MSDRDLKGKKVLIVEDEARLVALLEEALDDFGCDVVDTASRFEEAMAKASSLPLDVAVLDVNLNGILSFPIAEELQARHIPFVFATASSPAMLMNAPTAPVLCKPYQLADLEHALLEAVELASAARH